MLFFIAKHKTVTVELLTVLLVLKRRKRSERSRSVEIYPDLAYRLQTLSRDVDDCLENHSCRLLCKETTMYTYLGAASLINKSQSLVW